MSGGLSSASGAEVNDLSNEAFIAMLKDGTGLNAEAVNATLAEWGPLPSLVELLFLLPSAAGTADRRNFRRDPNASSSSQASRTDQRSVPSVTLIATEVAKGITGREAVGGDLPVSPVEVTRRSQPQAQKVTQKDGPSRPPPGHFSSPASPVLSLLDHRPQTPG